MKLTIRIQNSKPLEQVQQANLTRAFETLGLRNVELEQSGEVTTISLQGNIDVSSRQEEKTQTSRG